jgi:hypothetical protein
MASKINKNSILQVKSRKKLGFVIFSDYSLLILQYVMGCKIVIVLGKIFIE